MDILRRIAERKIEEAIERGDFDNLALKGQPLQLEDLSSVPEDLRLGYTILKNAGVLPPEMDLRKELMTLQDLIQSCGEEDRREALKRKMSHQLLRYRILMERNIHLRRRMQ